MKKHKYKFSEPSLQQLPASPGGWADTLLQRFQGQEAEAIPKV